MNINDTHKLQIVICRRRKKKDDPVCSYEMGHFDPQ